MMSRRETRGRRRWLPSVQLLALLVLAACSSVSLKESPSVRPAALPVLPPAAVGASPQRPAPAATIGTVPARRASEPDREPALPEPAAVPPYIAVHFPDPGVSFATPAFRPGRRSLTSNAENRAWLQAIADRSGLAPGGTRIELLDLGLSQQGRPIEALSFTRPFVAAEPAPAGDATATGTPLVAATRRPAIALIAGQHGDEPAGSEALLVIAAQLGAGQLDAVLARYDVVLLPRANPDGSAAFRRDAADGRDINRDHLLLNTPEAQAEAQLLKAFAPVVVADLHEYRVDGSFPDGLAVLPRADALLQAATVADLPAFIGKAAEEWFRAPLAASLRASGYSSDWYYTLPATAADKRLSMGGIGPQIGRNAAGLRSAVSLLVESRGGGLGRADLARRVQTQVLAVRSILGSAVLHTADLARVREYVDRETVSLACRGEALLEAAQTPGDYVLTVIDAENGALRQLNVGWRSSLALRPLKSRPRPCGYWLAGTAVDAVRRLRLLGIEVSQLDEAGEVRGETYRETGREAIGSSADGPPAEAGAATRLLVQRTPALLDLPAGSYYVGLDQPLGRLAVAVLEPESPAGYAANGVFAGVADEARVLQRPQVRMQALP